MHDSNHSFGSFHHHYFGRRACWTPAWYGGGGEKRRGSATSPAAETTRGNNGEARDRRRRRRKATTAIGVVEGRTGTSVQTTISVARWCLCTGACTRNAWSFGRSDTLCSR